MWSRSSRHGLSLLHNVGGLGEEDLECWGDSGGWGWSFTHVSEARWDHGQSICSCFGHCLVLHILGAGFQECVSRACERVRRKPCCPLFLSPRCHRESPPLPCTGWSCHPGWYSRGGDIDPSSPWYFMGQESLHSFGSPMCTEWVGRAAIQGAPRGAEPCVDSGHPHWVGLPERTLRLMPLCTGTVVQDFEVTGKATMPGSEPCSACPAFQHQGWYILVPELVLHCYL